MPRANKSTLEQWQKEYDTAHPDKPGKVIDVFGKLGRFGGLAIWVEVKHPGIGHNVFYSPYLNPSPGDGEHVEGEGCTCESCQFEDDPGAWLSGMLGAQDWGDVDWGPGEEFIPAH